MLAFAACGVSAHAVPLTWDTDPLAAGAQGGAGTWANGTTNWWNGAANVVWPDSGTENDAIFGGTAGSVTLTSVTANDLTFETTGYALAAGTLTLNGTTPTLTTGTGIAATIGSSIAGTAGLTKAGAGTLLLSGANSYTGTTTISPGGTLSISSDANLGTAPATATAGSLVIDSTGTLATTASFTLDSNRGIKIGPSTGTGVGTFEVASGTILTYGGIITSNGASGTGGLTKTGTGTLLLSGANTYSGTTTLAAGTLLVGSATAIPAGSFMGDLVVDATLDLNGHNVAVNGLSGTTGIITTSAAGAISFSAGGNNKGGTYNGTIQNGSGTIAFVKTGTNTITLGGNNTFTGGLTITGGILQLANAGALNSTAPNSLTFGPGAAVGTRLQLNGYSVTVGSLATNAVPGTVIVENANAAGATLTVNQAGDTTFAGMLQNGSGDGVLALTKTGVGSLTLAGTTTYSGTTTISGGTLALAGGTALPDTGAVVLTNTAGATLLLNASETIGSLAGGGASGGNVNLQSHVLTTGGANTDTTFSGVLSGTGSLVKTGSGTLTCCARN